MDYLIVNPIHDVEIKPGEETCGIGIVVTPEKFNLKGV